MKKQGEKTIIKTKLLEPSKLCQKQRIKFKEFELTIFLIIKISNSQSINVKFRWKLSLIHRVNYHLKSIVLVIMQNLSLTRYIITIYVTYS